jgi:hypothetical protein
MTNRILSSGITVTQAHASPQISLAAVNAINEENIARIEQDDDNVSRKQGKVRTLDVEYGISREVLERHSGKKLEEVASILGSKLRCSDQ